MKTISNRLKEIRNYKNLMNGHAKEINVYEDLSGVQKGNIITINGVKAVYLKSEKGVCNHPKYNADTISILRDENNLPFAWIGVVQIDSNIPFQMFYDFYYIKKEKIIKLIYKESIFDSQVEPQIKKENWKIEQLQNLFI